MSTIKEATTPDNAENLLELKLNFENYLGDIYIPIANIIFPYEDMSTPFDSAFFDYLAEDIKAFEEKIANLKLLEKADGAPNFINASFEELLDTPVDQGADAARNVSVNTNAGEVNSQANDLSTGNALNSSGTYQLYSINTVPIASITSGSTSTTTSNVATQYYMVNTSSSAESQGFAARMFSFEALAVNVGVGKLRSLLDNPNFIGKVLTLEGISDSPNGPFNLSKLDENGNVVPISLRGGTITEYANGTFDFQSNHLFPQASQFYYQVKDANGNLTVNEVHISEIQNQTYFIDAYYSLILDQTSFSITGSLLLGDAGAPGTTLSVNSIEPDFDSNNVFQQVNASLTLDDVLSNFTDSFTINPDGTFTFSAVAQGQINSIDSGSLDFFVNDGQGNSVLASAFFDFAVHTESRDENGDGSDGDNGSGSVKPVVLDFAGDGIHLLSPSQSAVTLGSLNGSDSIEKVGWVANDDGILMYDPKGHGEFSSLSQIAFASYLPGAKTDLEGLKAFDSNHDSVLDNLDKSFNDFGVLFADGKYETLDQLGIVSISLESNNQVVIKDGNTIYGESSYQTSSGKVLTVADVGLGVAVASSNPPQDVSSPSSQVSPAPIQEQVQQAVQEVVQLV